MSVFWKCWARKPTLIVTLLLALCVSLQVAQGQHGKRAEASVDFPGREKLLQLAQMTRKMTTAHSRLLTLSLDLYKDLVIKQPRPYSVVVLFTTALQLPCPSCRLFEEGVEKVAKEYYEASVKSLSPELISAAHAPHPTFFVRMILTDKPSVANLHGIEELPLVAVVTPKLEFTKLSLTGSDGGKKTALGIPSEFKLTPRSASVEGFSKNNFKKKLLEYINDRTGWKDVTLKQTLGERFQTAGKYLAYFAIGAFFVYKTTILARRHNNLVPVFGLIIMIFSFGGIVWSILHDFKLWGVARDGTIQLISRGRRSQYVVEGLLMSSQTVVISFSLYAASMLFRHYPHRKAATAVAVLLLLIAVISHSWVTTWHEYKSGMGSLRFWPPSSAARGPVMNDRGNSF